MNILIIMNIINTNRKETKGDIAIMCTILNQLFRKIKRINEIFQKSSAHIFQPCHYGCASKLI